MIIMLQKVLLHYVSGYTSQSCYENKVSIYDGDNTNAKLLREFNPYYDHQKRLLAPETHCWCISIRSTARRFPVSESSTSPLKVGLVDDEVR